MKIKTNFTEVQMGVGALRAYWHRWRFAFSKFELLILKWRCTAYNQLSDIVSSTLYFLSNSYTADLYLKFIAVQGKLWMFVNVRESSFLNLLEDEYKFNDLKFGMIYCWKLFKWSGGCWLVFSRVKTCKILKMLKWSKLRGREIFVNVCYFSL